jgi:hypothetical protein
MQTPFVGLSWLAAKSCASIIRTARTYTPRMLKSRSI